MFTVCSYNYQFQPEGIRFYCSAGTVGEITTLIKDLVLMIFYM